MAALFAVLAGTAVVTATACNDDSPTQPQPVGTFIGPDGGTVTVDDVTLAIPAGALTEVTDVVIESLADASYTADAFFVDGTAHLIKPAGLALNGSGATLTIRYQAGNVPAGQYEDHLQITERELDQWQVMAQNQVRMQERAVQALINEFGTFGVVGVDPATLPVASVVVEPSNLSLKQNETGQLAATALCSHDHPLEREFVWSSSDEAFVTVDATGLVTGVAAGAADITAEAEGVSGSAAVTVEAVVASIEVSPSTFDIVAGEEVQLTAVAYDLLGNVVVTDFVWTSSDESIATVDQDGLVTGVNDGNVTISAAAGGKQGSAGGSARRVTNIVIETPSEEPLGAGLTRQLTATAYDQNGSVVNAHFIWESSAPGVATVDDNGLVTGVARGTANISASVKTGASASIQIRVIPGGGEEETTGNNLSWPIVFAEGIGITGSPVATDPGVRPSTAEVDAYAELMGRTDPFAEFFYSGNVADVDVYYLQGTANAWRAQIVDGTSQAPYDASAYWGDNLSGTGNLGVDHPIRVEVALSTTDGVSLLGYNMPYVQNPSSPDEIQGTDGSTAALIPLIYTVGPTLTIEQLSGPGGSVIATVSSGLYKAEINVGGRVIYGAQFRPTVAGTYRLRFILASGANVRITDSNATVVSANETAIEIEVTP